MLICEKIVIHQGSKSCGICPNQYNGPGDICPDCISFSDKYVWGVAGKFSRIYLPCGAYRVFSDESYESICKQLCH